MPRFWRSKNRASAASDSVDALANHTARPARSRRKRRTRLVAAGTGLVATTAALVMMFPASQAKAAGFTNSAVPMSVGDRVWMGNSVSCTVGAVLRSTAAVTNYQDSVRWLLLAGHCGNVGDVVFSANNQVLGKVDWKPGGDDLLTVRVEPGTTTVLRVSCFPGTSSRGGVCRQVPTQIYYPKAKGVVSCVSTTPKSGRAWLWGVPPDDNSVRMCGATTGRDLYYKPIDNPGPSRPPLPEGQKVGQISRFCWCTPSGVGQRALPGDSGGPVFLLDAGSNTVRLYAIVSTTRTNNATGIHDITVVPLARYFAYSRNRLTTELAVD